MSGRHIGVAVGRRQLIQRREAQIPAVHANSNQGLSKEILLGLADGVVSPVVNHEYLDSHSVVDNSLQLLKVHLHASVPGHQNQVIPASVPALAVAALIPGSGPGADCCRQIISHGGNGGIGDKTLALLNNIGMSSYHTGGTIAHHRHLPLSQAAADSMDKRVHISRFLIRMGKVLGQYNRIFLFPHGAGPAPCHIPEALSSVKYLSAAGTADALGKAPLFLCQNTVQNPVQLFQKILCIGMDPHVAAD